MDNQNYPPRQDSLLQPRMIKSNPFSALFMSSNSSCGCFNGGKERRRSVDVMFYPFTIQAFADMIGILLGSFLLNSSTTRPYMVFAKIGD